MTSYIHAFYKECMMNWLMKVVNVQNVDESTYQMIIKYDKAFKEATEARNLMERSAVY
jgi:hypothetical protein